VITTETSHGVFRSLLHALAEPGTLRQLPMDEPRDDGLVLAALALADVEVSVHADDDDLATRVRQLSGAREATAGAADLVLVRRPDRFNFATLRRGSALEPELGAKVFIAVDRLAVGRHPEIATHVELTGPGVPRRRPLAVDGIALTTLVGLGSAAGLFPAGLDTWLIARDGLVAGLARTTTVESGGRG
jgi:alpha-D-ribose 1-methylphosphonate 5-triphosphate synthase subunit PhnH